MTDQLILRFSTYLQVPLAIVSIHKTSGWIAVGPITTWFQVAAPPSDGKPYQIWGVLNPFPHYFLFRHQEGFITAQHIHISQLGFASFDDQQLIRIAQKVALSTHSSCLNWSFTIFGPLTIYSLLRLLIYYYLVLLVSFTTYRSMSTWCFVSDTLNQDLVLRLLSP